MKIKKYNIPIYYGTLIIIIDKYPFKKAVKKFKLENCETYDAFVWSDFDKKGCSRYFICADKKISGSVIAHECVHLVNNIFSDRHIFLDKENDEPQAYLTGWLFKKIEKCL